MPEYLAPGVYVEEVSFRSKSIEGVSTTTTGFIGPSRNGPTTMEPDILTSLGEFERIYGDGQPLVFAGNPMPNFLWQAVRAFFEEGGKRLYVVRTYREGLGGDGRARWNKPADLAADDDDLIGVQARWPGLAGETRVRLTVRLSQNVFSRDMTDQTTIKRVVNGLQDNDIVWISDRSSPINSPPGAGTFYRAESYYDSTAQQWRWRFHAQGVSIDIAQLYPDANPAVSDQIRIATLAVTVFPADPAALPRVWSDLPLDPAHMRFGMPDSFSDFFAEAPPDPEDARTLPITITRGANVRDGLGVLAALNRATITAANPGGRLLTTLNNLAAGDVDRSIDLLLTGGSDGLRPGGAEYRGEAPEDRPIKTGLKALEDIEDISIVAAPGSTFGYEEGFRDDALTIIGHLIGHAERMRYRIAVIDSGDGQGIGQVRAMRAKLDSKYAALYYPWVTVLDPITRVRLDLPPSGFVSGVYARNDINRAVWKAPANEVINLAISFEHMINKAQQEVLNPEGINCLRFFEGRGNRIWGARTISSDPEWKYVNLRRYFAYLERSIDRGTQWAVFEPNGEALWANVRRTIEDFMLNEWQMGALLGDKPEKAYFVRCDRSTMTQNDLDNGRLVCLIGLAPLRPAEFVIFRIGQWTADRKS